MTQNWLLVETLGDQPVIAAQGRQMKNFIPLANFLRRNPNLAAIQAAVAETLAAGTPLVRTVTPTAKSIRTEPVVMTDGRIHGVQLWVGPVDAEPAERPLPGPFRWDLTTGTVTDSPQAMINGGLDPTIEAAGDRVYAEDVPNREILRDEAKVLSLMIDAKPDQTICSSWDFTDSSGQPRRVGFVLRTAWEQVGATPHVILRGMNLLDHLRDASGSDQFTQRIISGLAEPGVYRAIADIHNRQVLKWLDGPCPFFEWRNGLISHPSDRAMTVRFLDDLGEGSVSGVMRLSAPEGGWVPVHVVISRVEVADGIHAALLTFRQPTEAELRPDNTD